MLNYIYVTENDWGRILWHDYYEERGRIDTLYLGSSHVYCDLDPKMLDELNGGYNFNLASQDQRLNGTFYMLREAGSDNELKHVYVELFHRTCTNDMANMDPVDEAYLGWHNTDYMRPSVNKWAYMSSVTNWNNCVENWLPFVRFREKLGDWEYMESMVEHKNTEEYKNYQYHNEIDTYVGRGRLASTNVLEDSGRCFMQDRILGEYPLSDKSKQYLQMIIRYCQEREIPITLFVSPIDELYLLSAGNYDNYVNQVREFADEYKIPFYDFNLTKDEYLPIHYNQYYRDLHHLNETGAKVFTRFFDQVVSQQESENAAYFYGSYAEKLRESAPAVYGIYYSDFESGKSVWVASNRESGMEYRIIMTPTEGEQYAVQDFSENKEFVISPEEHGICTIVARMAAHPDDVVQTMEINY
ncbi:MAG: hypothetical protein NC416_18355 [Eubacterium sp.]|nr:hypothetical protein [Eubacterium sp.]